MTFFNRDPSKSTSERLTTLETKMDFLVLGVVGLYIALFIMKLW